MKHLVKSILLIVITTNLVSMPASGNELYGKPTVTDAQLRIAIRNAPALAKARLPKPKLFRSNPHRVSHFALIDDQDDIFVADDDLATGYRRRDLNKVEHEDGISEKVRWRLFLARQMALLKYKEKWA